MAKKVTGSGYSGMHWSMKTKRYVRYQAGNITTEE